jgi:Ser/Thr protein kinase RdoA (MazF antagonist)
MIAPEVTLPTSDALVDRVVALLRDPFDVQLARWIFGTTDPLAIAGRVERFCRDRLDSEVVRCEEFIQSVGAVFVLGLKSGERVVLKFHVLDDARWATAGSLAALQAVYDVQSHLAARGVPCAAVLQEPAAWEGGAVAAMAYLDGSEAGDAREPPVRQAMARMLVELARVAAPLRDTPMLPVWRLPEGLWPLPHNVLFDLTTPGGEWIDGRARQARAVLDTSSPAPILFHTDFSAANVRVRAGRVCAIYDTDSLALVDEMRALASTAVHHTYTGTEHVERTTRAQARAFVADYVAARGHPLTPLERERLDAAAVYSMAYTARCEHSGDPEGRNILGSMRAVLLEAPPTGYLS